MPLKSLDQQNQGLTSDAIMAVSYATIMHTEYEVNVRVTNDSWGKSDGFNAALRDATAVSGEAGILFVAAAGNTGRGVDNHEVPLCPPSHDLPSVEAVAASCHDDKLARFSIYGGNAVDLAAPGVGILSTLGGGYASRNGTSMAAPHVTGIAALVFSKLPDATVDEVRAALLASVDPLDGPAGKVTTGERLNAHRALTVDTYAPRVTQTVVTDTTPAGGTEQSIAVTFQDNVMLSAASLDNRAVAVLCQSGQPFEAAAEFVSMGPAADGTHSVVYRVTPPGGQWDSADTGTYQISLQPNQVTNSPRNAAWQQGLGTFLVEVAVAGALTVNVTADVKPGDCQNRGADGETSFRAVLMEANAVRGLDTIVLPAGLTLAGAGADQTVIDAADPDGVFEVVSGIPVNLSGVTLTSGMADAGGGLRNRGGLILEDAVIAGNQSTGAGGGVFNAGTLTIRRTNVWQNTTAFSGGGIRNDSGTLTVAASTLDGNQTQASDGCIHSVLDTVITNSILSGSTANPDFTGTLSSYGHNLIGNFGTAAAVLVPQSGPLRDSGGPTWTHPPLLRGNPAIDAGSDTDPLATDQRGVPRPAEGAGFADIQVDDCYGEIHGVNFHGAIFKGQSDASGIPPRPDYGDGTSAPTARYSSSGLSTSDTKDPKASTLSPATVTPRAISGANSVDQLLLLVQYLEPDGAAERLAGWAESPARDQIDPDTRFRVLQTLFALKAVMPREFWLRQFARDPSRLAAIAFGGLALLSWRTAISFLSQVPNNAAVARRIGHALPQFVSEAPVDSKVVMQKLAESSAHLHGAIAQMVKSFLRRRDAILQEELPSVELFARNATDREGLGFLLLDVARDELGVEASETEVGERASTLLMEALVQVGISPHTESEKLRRGRLFQLLRGAPVPDGEVQRCVEYILSQMVLQPKGSLAECLAIRPCSETLQALKGQQKLPSNAQFGRGAWSHRLAGRNPDGTPCWAEWREAADGLFFCSPTREQIAGAKILTPNAPPMSADHLVVFGAVEVKCFRRIPRQKLESQLDTHLARLAAGLQFRNAAGDCVQQEFSSRQL
jgi:hypothetical protein